MATKKTRMKSTAVAVAVPQSRSMCADDIRRIGDLQREHARISGELNDRIAALTEAEAPRLKELQDRIGTLQAGVQTWCEANREQLCGKGKSANLITGEVGWRQRPPSVRVTGEESVIDLLKRMALGRFVRNKEAVNKEAILNEPDAVAGVPGIKVITGVEDFVITPFEVETEAA